MITTVRQITLRYRRSRKGKLRHDAWLQDNEGRWYVWKKRWKLTEAPADEKELGTKVVGKSETIGICAKGSKR